MDELDCENIISRLEAEVERLEKRVEVYEILARADHSLDHHKMGCLAPGYRWKCYDCAMKLAALYHCGAPADMVTQSTHTPDVSKTEAEIDIWVSPQSDHIAAAVDSLPGVGSESRGHGETQVP